MNIFHYRQTDYNADPWQNAIINADTPLDEFLPKTLVTLNGQTIIRQHGCTYLTGRETCHAHHYAKMIATAIIRGNYPQAPSLNVTLDGDSPGTVLWIDSLHSVHTCTDFYHEMNDGLESERLSFFCLDRLGNFRYSFDDLTRCIEQAVKLVNPTLLVIDDIDHLMPYCGINAAIAFHHAVRDIINHSNTACLFIGYNHLGKRASTTGNLGKTLFTTADTTFALTTQQATTSVRLLNSFLQQDNRDSQFHFTIGDDNLPHEVIDNPEQLTTDNLVNLTTLRDIIGEIINPGETISPDELYLKLNSRRQQLNRCDRTRAIIAQAAQLGIITKAGDNNLYTLAPHTGTSPLCHDGIAALPAPDVNTSLTLPPHPSTHSTPPNENVLQ
ncbi:MAG: hypothetical protein IJK41_01730 [Muribaculaceae bacterium]|nr:hypothetical protein [Muribaculaceae bacterium]